MDATGTERAVIVSLSVGAQRALILAAEHPDRVTGATFICPALPLASPLEDHARYLWDLVLPTDEGWPKDNFATGCAITAATWSSSSPRCSPSRTRPSR